MSTTGRGLLRDIKPMPGFVKSALVARKLMEAYRSRPPYQQNEYLSWIDKAKLVDTKRKRLAQMLDELSRGGVYMGEAWQPPPPVVR